jgi:hypothetical protein
MGLRFADLVHAGNSRRCSSAKLGSEREKHKTTRLTSDSLGHDLDVWHDAAVFRVEHLAEQKKKMSKMSDLNGDGKKRV